MQNAIDKLDNRVIDIAEQTRIDALENFKLDSSRFFIKDTLKIALNKLLVSILNDTLGIMECFEYAMVRVATTPHPSAVVASAAAKSIAAMGLNARFAASIVTQHVEESVKNLVFSPFLPPSSGSYSPFYKARKSHEEKRPEKKSSRRKLCVLSSNNGTWSFEESMKRTTKLFEVSTMSTNVNDRNLKLKYSMQTTAAFKMWLIAKQIIFLTSRRSTMKAWMSVRVYIPSVWKRQWKRTSVVTRTWLRYYAF